MSLGMPINDGLRAQELKGIITNIISCIIEFCIIFDNKYIVIFIISIVPILFSTLYIKNQYWIDEYISWDTSHDYIDVQLAHCKLASRVAMKTTRYHHISDCVSSGTNWSVNWNARYEVFWLRYRLNKDSSSRWLEDRCQLDWEVVTYHARVIVTTLNHIISSHYSLVSVSAR